MRRVRTQIFASIAALLMACGSESPPVVPVVADAGPPPELPVIARFEAAPGRVTAGERTTLSYLVTGAEHLELLAEPGGVLATPREHEGNLVSDPLLASLQFVLRASNGAGTSSAAVAITVDPPPPQIHEFEVTPALFNTPEVDVTLRWRATGALRLNVNGAPRDDFPGREATSWMLRLSGPARFELFAESAGVIVSEVRDVRREGRELEPNDTRERADPLDDGGRIAGRITPDDVDWYRVMVPAGGAIRARTEDGIGRCPFDSFLELWGPDPERPGAQVYLTQNDDGPPGALCAAIDPKIDPAAASLLEGPHFLAVRGFDRAATGNYVLFVDVILPGCGNGLEEPGETCDDGNLVPGDGCNSTCIAELAGNIEGPDVERTFTGQVNGIFTAELFLTQAAVIHAQLDAPTSGVCGGSSLSLSLLRLDSGVRPTIVHTSTGACPRISPRLAETGRYHVRVQGAAQSVALRVAAWARGCGDALKEGAEACDDGNRSDGDGCNSTCEVESEGVVPPGGGVQSVSLRRPFESAVHLFVPAVEAGDRITVAAPSGCAREVAFALLDTDLRVLGEIEARGPECATLDPGRDAWARDLAAGDYFLRIRALSEPARTVEVEISRAPAECGNGDLELQAGEQCDDQNLADGDGCNSACEIEAAGVLVGNDAQQTFVGSIPAGRPQLYKVVTALGGALEVTTLILGGSCTSTAGADLALGVTDDRFRSIVDHYEPASCPQLNGQRAVPLPAGTHWVSVRTRSGARVPSYLVGLATRSRVCGDNQIGFGEDCDDGNASGNDGCSAACLLERPLVREVEPNDEESLATPFVASFQSPTWLAGRFSHLQDRDLWSFTVLPRQVVSLRAHTFAGPSPSPTNCQTLLDTQLALYDAAGQRLAEHDDLSFSNRCSRLDGTTGTAGARNLLPGTYFLEVRPDPTTTRIQYFVEVDLQ